MSEPRFRLGQVVKSHILSQATSTSEKPNIVRGRVSSIFKADDGYRYLVAGKWYKQKELIGLTPMVSH